MALNFDRPPPAHAVNANQNSDASSASGSRRGENRSRGRDRRRANCLHAIPYKSSLFLLDYLASFGNFAKHCVGRSGFVSALSILHGVVRGPSPQRLRTLVGDAEKWLHLSKAKIESPLFSSSFWLRLCNSAIQHDAPKATAAPIRAPRPEDSMARPRSQPKILVWSRIARLGKVILRKTTIFIEGDNGDIT